MESKCLGDVGQGRGSYARVVIFTHAFHRLRSSSRRGVQELSPSQHGAFRKDILLVRRHHHDLPEYHKGANAGQPVKLIPRFLPPELNSLFIEYMLLVKPVQSFIAGLRGNIDAARQHMDLWAIQRDVAMDGEDVSRLVATAFLEHANLDMGIADYRHLAAYFNGAIKQSYCTKFPIDETSGHSSTTTAR